VQEPPPCCSILDDDGLAFISWAVNKRTSSYGIADFSLKTPSFSRKARCHNRSVLTLQTRPRFSGHLRVSEPRFRMLASKTGNMPRLRLPLGRKSPDSFRPNAAHSGQAAFHQNADLPLAEDRQVVAPCPSRQVLADRHDLDLDRIRDLLPVLVAGPSRQPIPSG